MKQHLDPPTSTRRAAATITAKDAPHFSNGSAPGLVSRVQQLAAGRNMDESDFIAACVGAKVCGVDVAKKIWRGETNIRVVTAAGVAALFGVQLNALIEIV